MIFLGFILISICLQDFFPVALKRRWLWKKLVSEAGFVKLAKACSEYTIQDAPSYKFFPEFGVLS